MARQGLINTAIARIERGVFLLAKQARQRIGTTIPRLHVLVAGVQRSGTNMLMDVLERSWDTDLYHEMDVRSFDIYEMRPRSVIHALM